MVATTTKPSPPQHKSIFKQKLNQGFLNAQKDESILVKEPTHKKENTMSMIVPQHSFPELQIKVASRPPGKMQQL